MTSLAGGVPLVLDGVFGVTPPPGGTVGGVMRMNARGDLVAVIDSPIPEPATLALAGLALFGLGWSRRARARA